MAHSGFPAMGSRCTTSLRCPPSRSTPWSPSLSAGGFVNEQVIRGCYFGSAHLQRDVPALAGHYLAGNLLLDELITRRIGLDELNGAFDALRAGRGARSVLVLD
jgi:S-(hydroxymethyl)glutathione dehydrogenase / alcohol dehydrogenase